MKVKHMEAMLFTEDPFINIVLIGVKGNSVSCTADEVQVCILFLFLITSLLYREKPHASWKPEGSSGLMGKPCSQEIHGNDYLSQVKTQISHLFLKKSFKFHLMCK